MIFSGKRQRWKPLKIIVAKEEVMAPIEAVSTWHCIECDTQLADKDAECPSCAAGEKISRMAKLITQLRAVIEQVEFIEEKYVDGCGDYDNRYICPWCNDEEPDHKRDCPRQAALKEAL